MIEFIIPTAAVGKGRPRVTSRGTYTPQKTKDYEAFVQTCFRKSRCRPYAVSTQPLKAEIVACFAVPKSYAKKRRAALLGKPHTHKPDADNLAKGILDALNGLAYPDDAQIAALEVGKFYSDRDFVLVKIYSEEETT